MIADHKFYYKYEDDGRTLTLAPTRWAGCHYATRRNHGDWPWCYDARIEKVVLTDTVSPMICKRLFAHMTNLTEIEGLKYLDMLCTDDMSHMFEGCLSLKSLDFGRAAAPPVGTNLGHAFEGCRSLTDLRASEPLMELLYGEIPITTSIVALPGPEEIACDGTVTLTADMVRDGVVLPDGTELELSKGDVNIPHTIVMDHRRLAVTEIGRDAFRNEEELASVTIPHTVRTIDNNAFDGCSSLKSVVMLAAPKSSVPGDFVTAHGVSTIRGWAFQNCPQLSSVSLPESLTAILSHAFQNCTKLSSVTIPDSIERINPTAFHGCKNLSDISLPSGRPDLLATDASAPDTSTNARRIIHVRPTPTDFASFSSRFGSLTPADIGAIVTKSLELRVAGHSPDRAQAIVQSALMDMLRQEPTLQEAIVEVSRDQEVQRPAARNHNQHRKEDTSL